MLAECKLAGFERPTSVVDFHARMAALASSGLGAYLQVSRLQTAQLSLAMERWHRERQEMAEPMAAEDVLREQVLALRTVPA